MTACNSLGLSYCDERHADWSWSPARIFEDDDPPDPPEDDPQAARLFELCGYLHPEDQALLWWRAQGESQPALARRFGVAQPTVCCRLHALYARLAWMLAEPHVSDERLHEFLDAMDHALPVSAESRATVFAVVQRFTYQQAAGRRVGRSQSWTRRQLDRALRVARREPNRWPDVIEVFESALLRGSALGHRGRRAPR